MGSFSTNVTVRRVTTEAVAATLEALGCTAFWCRRPIAMPSSYSMPAARIDPR